MDGHSHIKDNLYMGGLPDSEDGAPSYRFIVNVAPWWPYPVHEHQLVTAVKLLDSAEVPDEDLLYAIARHVNELCKLGPTLVHCQAGMNRSGLICALALMLEGMSADDAIALLRAQRFPEVLMNDTFRGWLKRQDMEVVA